jgi:aspartate/methionine/tyrosine aminotransferase
MKLAPFLLDRWLDDHDYPSPEFNLGGSTGPRWTLGEVLDLEPGSRDRLFRSNVVYAPSAGAPGLREAIAAMSGVDSEQVLVVAGGSEALLHVFFDAAERGANVLVPFPGFPPYAAIPEAVGIEVRPYRLRREAAYRIDFDEVERLADRRTTLLLVNSPHNPTGATLDASDMRRLHDFAADRGIQFISDEVFHPIYHGPPGASAATLPHATVIGDLSKAFSLSGLRLGWIVERNEERRARYINARQYFTISNTVIGEMVGEIAIRHRETILGRTLNVARTNLVHADSLMVNLGEMLDWVRPSGGMTGFPRLISGDNTRPFCESAAQRGVLVVPGDCFGMPDHLRLGFGVGEEWYPAAMERLDALLRVTLTTTRTGSRRGL